MCWTIKLASAVRQLAAARGTFNETAESLVANGRLVSAEHLQQWYDLASGAAEHNLLLTLLDALGDPIDPDSGVTEFSPDQELRVRVTKGSGPLVRFFTLEGFRNGLTAPDVVRRARLMLVAEDFAPFRSATCEFRPWDTASNSLAVPVGEGLATEVDPKKLVRDAIGGALPTSIEFWLPGTAPESVSPVYTAWMEAASEALLLAPAAEVWPGEDDTKVVLAGPRKRTLPLKRDAFQARQAFVPLTDAVRWVCDVPREAEVRHTLLVKRLATEWPADDPPWAEGLPRVLGVALEGAKADYKAHLHEKTAETLKALGDLRKALNEETSKVVERTQGLTGALFRDLALAVGAISVRLLALSGDGKAVAGTRYVVVAIGVWLLISLWLSLDTNRRFLRLQARMRASWHRRIHAVLSSRDFTALARRPLKEATKAYRMTSQWVGVIYLVLVFSLIGVAII